MAVIYGRLPSFSTARLTAWMKPFYRAFETGQPQIVRLEGITNGFEPFIELFMVRGNQPGLERVTRFVP